MCIRDSFDVAVDLGEMHVLPHVFHLYLLESRVNQQLFKHCLLYTSDAADERSSVDLGGRRIIKKKNK